METKEEREKRKADFIAYALSKNKIAEDRDMVIKEAEEMFEKANPPVRE